MPECGMPAPLVTTPTVAHMTLESPSDKAITSLYRAALGPVNTERYMPVFARLDAVGRTLTSWHWSACFFTLGWMVFRRLWGAALVYVAAAEGVALLVFGVGRPLLQWPQAVEWGVVGAFAVVGSVIPGLYAHAILHADIRKRVTSALAASANIPQACDLLASQAVSRKRLHGVIGGHALIVAAALLAYVLFPQGLFDAPAAQPAAAAPQPASRAASWNQPEPTLTTASRTAVTASAAASPASAQAPLPEPDAGIPALAASAPLPATAPSSSASAPAAPPRTDRASQSGHRNQRAVARHPPQRQTSGSEQRESQSAPARQQGQRARQSIHPCARRVQNGFCHQVRRTCTRQARRQSACGGPCDRRLGARLLYQRGLVCRRKQCAQGAVTAAERGAASLPPDAGWRQGHSRARTGGALCVAQPGRGRCRHSQNVGTGSRGVPQVALTGKHRLTKPLSSIPNPTTRLLYVTKNSARC